MPPPRDQLGERISGLEATVAAFEKYTHQQWHDLGDRLQPLYLLPEQLIRDVAKMQGTFDGKIGALTREIDRSIIAAIEKAILPMNQDIADLRTDVDKLKLDSVQITGARRFAVWLVQTLLAAASAVVALLALGKHP